MILILICSLYRTRFLAASCHAGTASDVTAVILLKYLYFWTKWCICMSLFLHVNLQMLFATCRPGTIPYSTENVCSNSLARGLRKVWHGGLHMEKVMYSYVLGISWPRLTSRFWVHSGTCPEQVDRAHICLLLEHSGIESCYFHGAETVQCLQ